LPASSSLEFSTAITPTTRPSGHAITLSAVEHDGSIDQSGDPLTIVNDLISNGTTIGEGQVDCILSGRVRKDPDSVVRVRVVDAYVVLICARIRGWDDSTAR